MKEYWISKEKGLYVVRQTRFKERFLIGKEHPHDNMGGFVKSKKELRKMFKNVGIDINKEVEKDV